MSRDEIPQPVAGDAVKTPKGAETRARILTVALELFREKGYDKTTMRGIAEAAGVSLGNAYYYFRSKDELIQGFYDRMFEEHRRACVPLLTRYRAFGQRLKHVMLARQETAQPYHEFAGVLFRTAADPRSPLNPFSAASRPTRENTIAIFREVVDGSKERFPKDLEDVLPDLLWLLQMAMVLYWVHDSSPDCAKSRRLVTRSSTLVSRFLALIKLPPMRPLRKLALETYRELRDEE